MSNVRWNKVFQLWLLSWWTVFLISFVDALLMLWFFGASNIGALDDLTYWQLYWLNLGVLQPIGTAVGLQSTMKPKMKEAGLL